MPVQCELLFQKYLVEMKYAFERRNQGKAEVIPILLKAVSWEKTPFRTLQVIPRSKKPVADHTNKDRTLVEVAQEVEKVVNALIARKQVTHLNY